MYAAQICLLVKLSLPSMVNNLFCSYFCTISVIGLCTENETLVKINGSGAVPSPRSAATIAAVNSKLYLFGGLSNDSGWLGDFFVFDTGLQMTVNLICCNRRFS